MTVSVGAYLLERLQREVFTQATMVSALHDRVDMLLRTYLSPDVADTLIDDPNRASLGGVEVEVTVLFADLGGYTAFAERATPAEVVAMLNAAFGAAVPIVLAEGGAVVQFMGDAMMASSTPPTRSPITPCGQLARRWACSGRWVSCRSPASGLASSRPQQRACDRGNIGAAEIGTSLPSATPPISPRLQTYAPEGSIVISATTHELISRVCRRPGLGSPALKGKSQSVEVYELLGPP